MLKFLLTISFIIVAYVASSSVFCDWPKIWPFCFQDPASPICEGIIKLHHDSMFLLIFIAAFVLTLICFNKLLNKLKHLSILYYREFRAITLVLHITFISSCFLALIYSLFIEVAWCQGGTENIITDHLKVVKKNKPFMWAPPGEAPEYSSQLLRLYKALATKYVFKAHPIAPEELARLYEEINALKCPDVSHVTAPVDASRFNQGHYRWNLLSYMEKWRLNKELAHKAYLESLAAIASLEGDQLDKAIASAQFKLDLTAKLARLTEAELYAKYQQRKEYLQTMEDDPMFHLYDDLFAFYSKTIKFGLYCLLAVICLGVLYYISLLHYAALKKPSNNKNRTY
jgi:hypothetical protein